MSENFGPIVVNFGGKTEPGREYIYSLGNIIATAGVIQYPKKFTLDSENHKRTVDSLTPSEKAEFEAAPLEPMVDGKKQPVLSKKDGTPVMMAKVQDEIRFVFQNTETGSETGPYDFVFRCYPGFRPGNDLKAFLLTTKNIDATTMGGAQDLTAFYKKGDRFVIGTKTELRAGKYTQIDRASIRPYVEGMTLKKATSSAQSAEDKDDMDKKVIAAVKGKLPLNPMDIFKLTSELGPQNEVMAAYNRLKEKGIFKLVEGKIQMA